MRQLGAKVETVPGELAGAKNCGGLLGPGNGVRTRTMQSGRGKKKTGASYQEDANGPHQ